MTQPPLPPVRHDPRLAARIVGVVLMLLGAAAIATVFTANLGRDQAAERLAFRLGLAFAPMLSAVGLVLVLVGLFALLRGRRH